MSLFDELSNPSNHASGSFPDARPFQTSAHDALRDGARSGHKRQMLMSPTGSGKTYLGLNIIQESLLKGNRCAFMCDRTTLINQTSETADRYGLSTHGIIQSKHWRYNTSLPFQILSAQTIARRSWPEFDVIVIDEAHTQMKAWTDHIINSGAHVIGLSATPFSPGLGKMFTNLVNATTMHDLIEQKFLVPMTVFSCAKPDMTGAETSGGEWTDVAAQDRGMAIIGDVVSEWHKYGDNRKTIVFGATVRHCDEICRQFAESGVMARVFSHLTKDTERKEILDEYRKSDSMIKVLISVEALAKGFDVPDVGCVVDCRPLRKSLSTFIQMIGRGLRSSPETGKTDCIILDHSGNIVRFQEDFEHIYFNGLDKLDDGQKLDKTIRKDDEEEIAERSCPKCGYKPFHKRCMGCGYEKPVTALVENEIGVMKQIIIGKKKLADDKYHLYQQFVSYARQHSVVEKQAGRAAHLFKDIMGEWPSPDWRFETTPTVEVTLNVINKIRSKNIAYKKGRDKGLRVAT